MKNIFKSVILLFTGICFCSCVNKEINIGDKLYNGNNNDIKVTYDLPHTTYYTVITIEYDGNKHQFIKYNSYHQYGLTHWPDCKYCKKN